jgi:hypothetical protein
MVQVVGLISDTHGVLLPEVLQALSASTGTIIHAGKQHLKNLYVDCSATFQLLKRSCSVQYKIWPMPRPPTVPWIEGACIHIGKQEDRAVPEPTICIKLVAPSLRIHSDVNV